MRVIPLLLSSWLAIGVGAASARTVVPVLYFDGFGLLRIGMTHAQVEALGERIKPDAMFDPDHPESCWQGQVEGKAGVTAMFKKNRLVRVSLDTPDF
ncbi:MAG TPA: hypothetical protein VNB23_00535, partial [Ramlibacter sp.]|nr:hypothetical protein [Ramlibacter sp.]